MFRRASAATALRSSLVNDMVGRDGIGRVVAGKVVLDLVVRVAVDETLLGFVVQIAEFGSSSGGTGAMAGCCSGG